jgi:hypothetical protein
MNYFRISVTIIACGALALASAAQVTSATQPSRPAANNSGAVSVASMNQINSLLADVQRTAEATAVDIAGLRIEKWKADSGSKRQAQENATAILRNLQNALPAVITEVRSAPENLSPAFNLYRNLDAIYDVLGSEAELAGAFGSKNEYQDLSSNLANIERLRRTLAERIQNLAASRDMELARLRNEVRSAQAAATPPKKVIVDDEEPVKKQVKKKRKPAPKHATPAPATQQPAEPQSQSPQE